jgi:hypothetical protein
VSNRTNSARTLLGLVSLAAVFSCFSPARETFLTPSKDRFSEIKKSVVDLRGLVLKRDIEIDVRGTDGSLPGGRLDDTGAGGAIPISQLEHAYKQLGLIGASEDFKAELDKFHRLEQIVYYNGANARLTIAADAAALGAQLTAPYNSAAAELPVASGIVQALQEQHFQWQEKINRTVVEDARLAYRAIAGGDALLTALAYASDGNLNSPGHISAARQVSLEMARLARDLPWFLRRQLLLPLEQGSNFVAWAAKARGRDGVNALYATPPYTTAQILHPEKYFLVTQTPQRFFPAGLFRLMESPALLDQSLGEFLLRGLLEPDNSRAAAARIAAGWRGDQLFSFADSDYQTTAWYSAWGSVDEAAAFQRAFQTVAEKRHRIRMRADKDSDLLIAETRDQGSFALARKDNIVLYLITRTARLAATVEAAWKDLVVEAESEGLRFDSARSPINYR